MVALSDLQKAFNDTLGGDQGLLHAEVDLRADIQSLMDCLAEYKVYVVHLGRILSVDEIVKEVVGLGLHNLTAGETNPLSDYNDNITKLQKRRGMNPVTDDMDYECDHEPKILNPTAPSAPASQPKPSSPTATNDTDPIPATVDVGSDDEGPETEERTEIQQILAEVEGTNEPTLQRLTEEDVAYDMDEVQVEVEVEVSDEESDSDSDSGDESGGERD